jgi:hypothetical protein
MPTGRLVGRHPAIAVGHEDAQNVGLAHPGEAGGERRSIPARNEILHHAQAEIRRHGRIWGRLTTGF